MRRTLTLVAALALAGCAGVTAPIPAQTAERSADAVTPAALHRCDGHTDAYATLQKEIDAIGRRGGGTVFLPRGICPVSRTLQVNFSNVTLHGLGAGYPADDYAKIATGLLWIGPKDGTLLRFGSTKSPVESGGMNGVALLSNNGLAGYGLLLQGEEGGAFADFTADAFSKAAIQLGYTRFDQMHNIFTNYDLVNESDNTGAGIVAGTKRESTAYYNEFDDGLIILKNGIGIDIETSDGNYFTNTQEIMDPNGKGIGILFGCRATSNHFSWVTPAFRARAKSVVVLGTKACGGWPRESWANSIELYDQNDNGGPPPIVGNGTDFWCRNDANKPCGSRKGA